MAMTMNARSATARVAGRRVASKRVMAAFTPVRAVSSVAPKINLQKNFFGAEWIAAPRVAGRVARSQVVVEASKVSVGDLKKADLEGKRVFVRAGKDGYPREDAYDL